MKPKLVLTLLAALTLTATLAIVALGHRHLPLKPSPAGTRTFQVHGQIRGLAPADKTIRIAHDAVPNYMPAMTMSLPVKDTALLQNLAVGDEVQFELLVTDDDSWISHIEKIQSEATATPAEAKATRSPEPLEAERLQTGELVPDFQLTDQDGRPLHLKDFRGQAVVLTFVYTRCPLPNFCPLMSKNFAELQQRLSHEFPNKYHLLSISMDPEFDRPEVLKEYAARYGANPKDWSFAVGDTGSLNYIAGLVGLYFENENGLISHDLRTALIGPDGRLVQLWKSNVWTPYEVQRSVREVLTGHADVASQ
jgi:protein SCO1/2